MIDGEIRTLAIDLDTLTRRAASDNDAQVIALVVAYYAACQRAGIDLDHAIHFIRETFDTLSPWSPFDSPHLPIARRTSKETP